MSSKLPQPPFVDVDGIANFRDIGYVNAGKNVRRGQIYRAADPSKATPQGLETMSRDLGIKIIFDLRSTPEIQRDGPEWAGVEIDKTDRFSKYGMQRSWQPVFASKDYSPEQVALRYKEYTREGTDGFVAAYRDILRAGATAAYPAILKHLAQAEPSPCLIHCTAGKDRTGVLVALIFLLLSVPKEQIAQEYSLTDQGLAHLRPLFTERLMKNPALSGNPKGIENMISTKSANMVATIDMIDAEFGGAENYMREYCKLEDGEISQLRRNLESQ